MFVEEKQPQLSFISLTASYQEMPQARLGVAVAVPTKENAWKNYLLCTIFKFNFFFPPRTNILEL